jgi:hypothetical protein
VPDRASLFRSVASSEEYRKCCNSSSPLSVERGSPKVVIVDEEDIWGAKEGGGNMRQRMIQLATALGSIMALLVAGGARWKA